MIGLTVPGTIAAFAADSVCARVQIEIQQELTLERQAFTAHMRLKNGLDHITLENIRVDVSFADANGASVIASSDPANTDALFYIRLDAMENIDDVEGSGQVGPLSTADIYWLIIPSPGSSNGIDSGALYHVGAKLVYSIGGEERVTQVTPDYIFVKPMPDLALDYFLPTDVYGDDAFTAEVEPALPFSLGLRVTNTGHGVARNLEIGSAQAKIVDNDQGLLVGFHIEGTEVNGAASADSLLVDLGDIGSGKAATARWTMTCTLSGKMVDFNAGFTHSDELGGALTSLISNVRTHFLVHDVLVDLPGRDAVRDFLAKDNDFLRVYESDAVDSEVRDHSGSSALQISGDTGVLTTGTMAGFLYVKLDDPFQGEKQMKAVIRSDGKAIKPENVWRSKHRNEDHHWQHSINLFDVDTTGTYTIHFAEASESPLPPVLDFIGNRIGVEGQPVFIEVQSEDPNGTIPELSAMPLPAGADFSDQGNGFGIFRWTPASGQAGTYDITFKASDGMFEDRQRAALTIHPMDDSDGDGMLDAWEVQYFGSLDRDGNGDFDQDGISDLDEFIYGSDPTLEEHAPTTPLILSPQVDSHIAALQPELVIENSVDEDGDALSYEFEVFADPALTIKVAAAIDVVQGAETTFWLVPESLVDNARYYWRVRAADGHSYSLWAYGNFFVDTADNKPGPFFISSPADTTEVDSVTPVLEITNATDVDEDNITYTFEVYEDSTLGSLVASAHHIPEGFAGTTSWVVNPALADSHRYFWRVTAADGRGGKTQTAVGSFLVNTAGSAPPAPQQLIPAANSVVSTRQLDLVVINSTGAGSHSYYFELDNVNTFDSPAKRTSGEILEGIDTTAWHVSDLDENRWYYWRSKVGNGSAQSSWVQNAFFVSTANDPPLSPTLKNPGKRAWIGNLTPMLEINPRLDPDADSLNYRFEIYADRDLTTLVEDGLTAAAQWVVPAELSDKTRYFWRARAEDPHGLTSYWMDASTFFVNQTGPGEPPPEITVRVSTRLGSDLAGLKVYAFAGNGAYTGRSAVADESGTVLFDTAEFADGEYAFRIDYLGSHFWSDSIQLPGTYETDVIIEDDIAEITVNTGAGPSAGVKVYLFAAGGAYLGCHQKTNENGQVSFQLPTGVEFLFRADILGNRYWSDETILSTDDAATVNLDAGGGIFKMTLKDETDEPMAGVKTYLFSQTGSYLGFTAETDAMGCVSYAVPEGTYQVRNDFLGHQFWSPETEVITDTNIDVAIVHADLTVAVIGEHPENDEPLDGIKIYLFTPSGKYLGKNWLTDENGQVQLHLPQQPYQLRADFLGQLYWSDVFSGTDPTVIIPMADVAITVTAAGLPLQGQTVYGFSGSGSYLGIRQTTDSDGKVLWRLPEGEYKFRADFQGSQYWSDTAWVAAAQPNPVTISTGGGSFEVSVLKSDTEPLAGIKCYVFSTGGSYLGMHGATDDAGDVSFNLANGDFLFRADYLGSRFWSDVVSVPEILSTDVVIAHETAEVNVTTGAGAAEGVKVYLFSDTGSYLGRFKTTDSSGTVAFDLPVGRRFQFRADIPGGRYWSDIHNISDGGTNQVEINAGGGFLQMTVQKEDNLPLSGLNVYLFNEAGTYLGRSATSDDFGQVEFSVPENSYKLRVDYLGSQFWTEALLVAEDLAVTFQIDR
jgi:hypothetical protein